MKKRKVAGVSPVDARHKKQEPPMMGGTQLEANIRVDRPPEICYQYWRDFENLPYFMNHIQSVAVLDDRRSHWMVDAPADTTVEWDAEIIEDVENEQISWRSLENAQVDNAGSVQFSSALGGRATDVKVTLTYNPTLGAIGEALAGLFSESPDDELAEDLEHFKETLEKES